jgi:hypothetical protein
VCSALMGVHPPSLCSLYSKNPEYRNDKYVWPSRLAILLIPPHPEGHGMTGMTLRPASSDARLTKHSTERTDSPIRLLGKNRSVTSSFALPGVFLVCRATREMRFCARTSPTSMTARSSSPVHTASCMFLTTGTLSAAIIPMTSTGKRNR